MSPRSSVADDDVDDVDVHSDEDGFPLLPLHGNAAVSSNGAPERKHVEPVSICAPSFHSIFLITLLVAFSALVFAMAVSNSARSWIPFHDSPVTKGSSENLIKTQESYILDRGWRFDAPPTTREYTWTITNQPLNADGVYSSLGKIAINGQFPGPLIECNEGDTISVRMENRAVNATAIHWHGIYQNGTNSMDGTVGVTQCPIAPGADFIYRFTVTGQSGTYWYHAHQSMQTADGLYGPLVIHSKGEAAEGIASDRVLMVADHYYNSSNELLMQYLAPDRENIEPVPDTAVINGHNRRDCGTVPGILCDATEAMLEGLNLLPNAKHRIRFINTGVLAEFQIQVDEHDFAVTEVDGTDVVSPHRYHRLLILPSQRYSIILDTDSNTQKSFWLRARMITHCFGEDNPIIDPEVRAIIHYTDADETTLAKSIPPPISRDWPDIVEVQCRDMDTSDLRPVHAIPAPEPDAKLSLRVNFEIGDWALSRGFFDRSSWRPRLREPILHRVLDGIAAGNASFLPSSEDGSAREEGRKAFPASSFSSFLSLNDRAFNPAHELVYQSPHLSVIDLVFKSFDDGAHPLHLHGYKFFLLATGSGYPPEHLNTSLSSAGTGEEAAAAAAAEIDLSNPLRRDTATLPAYGWVWLRLVADNPGVWALHCHVGWHSEAGLAMVLWTRSKDMHREEDGVEEGRRLCSLEGVERGEGPGDEVWEGVVG